jgi:hypothetical protein
MTISPLHAVPVHAASRLSMDYERRFLAELPHGVGRKSTFFTSLLDYFDMHEYDLQHVLHNNSHSVEGPLLADFDHTYDPATYPDAEEGSVATHVRLPATEPSMSDSASRKKLGGPGARQAAQQHQEQQLGINARSVDLSFRRAKAWPRSLAEFQISDRVDAVDYKGTWYSGSVIDILYLTEKDIKTFSLARYSRDFLRKDEGKPQPHDILLGGYVALTVSLLYRAQCVDLHSAHSSAAASSSGGGGSKEACTPGLHARIHFDGFKGNWDEWYDQRDFERGEQISGCFFLVLGAALCKMATAWNGTLINIMVLGTVVA